MVASTMLSRRTLLAATLAAAGHAALPRRSAAKPRTRLILLGTAGGPTPKALRAAPAQIIVVDGVGYLIDAGNGVGRQLALAGIPLPSIRHLFVTHQHSDHQADYGTVLLLAWASGLRTPVDTWGPPPLARMTELALELQRADITTRMRDEGRPDPRTLFRPHERSTGGVVMQDERVRVTAALVDHPPVVPSFAYRFDTADRSIVISGDTTRSDALIRLARGADVLVHEAIWPPAIDRIVAGDNDAPALRAHLLASHTSAEDCGRVAAAAGVKTLVLSHFVPGGDATITDAMWREAAAKHFRGEIVVGRDLLEV